MPITPLLNKEEEDEEKQNGILNWDTSPAQAESMSFYGAPEEEEAFTEAPMPAPEAPAPTSDLETQLEADEGRVLKKYEDDRGNITIGVGHLVTPAEKASGKVYGIDISNGITKEQATKIKRKDIEKHTTRAKSITANFDTLPENVRNEIVNATFHGSWGGSPKARKLFADGKYEESADEFLNNKSYTDRQASGKGGTYTKRMERTANAIRGMAQEDVAKYDIPEDDKPVADSFIENLKGIKETPEDIAAQQSAIAEEEAVEMPAEQQEKMQVLTEDFSSKYAEQMGEFRKDAEELDSELLQEIGAAKAAYAAGKGAVESKAMWESVINGIGHLAAGLIGHQSGLNLGGIKFDKTNWDAQRDQLLSELRDSRGEAFSKMSAGQRMIAERRATASQDYNVEARDLDRALQQRRHNETLQFRDQQAVQKNLEKTEKVLAKVDDNKKKAIKDLLAQSTRATDKALNNLRKESNEDNIAALDFEVVRWNKQAEKLGLPPLYPTNLTKDESREWLWNKQADYVTINKRLQDFVQSGGQSAPRMKTVTLKSGKTVTVPE